MSLLIFRVLPAILLTAAAVNDIREYKIHAWIPIAGITVFACFAPFSDMTWFEIYLRVLSAAITAMSVLLIVLVCESMYKRKMFGGGDIRMIFAICLYFRWTDNMLALFFSCLYACIVLILNIINISKKIPHEHTYHNKRIRYRLAQIHIHCNKSNQSDGNEVLFGDTERYNNSSRIPFAFCMACGWGMIIILKLCSIS